jgi:uncharacterized ParB-like nuclease family protein
LARKRQEYADYEKSIGVEPSKSEIVEPAPSSQAEPEDLMESAYPTAKGEVDGRIVRKKIPNQDSIAASLVKYRVLPGVREVSMDSFDPEYEPVTDARTKKLAEEIKESGEVNPLIVVVDKDGPYILEGGHRYDALKIIGAKSIPAQVVIDEESFARQAEARQIHDKNLADMEQHFVDGNIAEEAHAAVKDGVEILKGHDIHIPVRLDVESSVSSNGRNLIVDPSNPEHEAFLLEYGMKEEQINELKGKGKTFSIYGEYVEGDLRGGGQGREEIILYGRDVTPADVYEEVIHALEAHGRLSAGDAPEGVSKVAHKEAHAKKVVQDVLAGKREAIEPKKIGGINVGQEKKRPGCGSWIRWKSDQRSRERS